MKNYLQEAFAGGLSSFLKGRKDPGNHGVNVVTGFLSRLHEGILIHPQKQFRSNYASRQLSKRSLANRDDGIRR
jgi:hypothetical protein